MIKLVTKLKSKEHDLLIVGLSFKNIEKLKEGKPILINLGEMGDFNIGEIFIFTGDTEQSILKELHNNFNLQDATFRSSNNDKVH